MRHSAKLGLLGYAIALAAGADLPAGMTPTWAMAQSDAIKFGLKNHYRTANQGKPTRAAHYKRLAKKRKNIRARSSKR